MIELNGKSEQAVDVLDLDDWELVHGGPFPVLGKVVKVEGSRVKLQPVYAYGFQAQRSPDGSQVGTSRTTQPIEFLGSELSVWVRDTMRIKIRELSKPEQNYFRTAIEQGEAMRKSCSAAAHGLTLATRMPDLAPPGVRS